MPDERKDTGRPSGSLETLIGRAFRRGPAIQANELIDEVRHAFLGELSRAANYEVSLLDRSWEDVCREEGARFRRYLRNMGYTPRRDGPVFVSLFHGDEVYFIYSQDFLDAIADDAEAGALLPVPVDK